ncbi:MAG: preprotein translocase subunit SecG [Clostridia bacterium]|nr:preprotein translocase subunit SecG [Clostridia bacterium]
MAWYEILMGVLLVVASIIIVIVVLLQQSREAGLSGVIAGGADTFFGKNKGRTMDAKLAKITKILSVFFFVFTLLAVYFLAFMTSRG